METLIRGELAGIVMREVKDPRVSDAGIPSVNKVELNRDSSVAWVYVSFLGRDGDDPAVAAAVRGLDRAAPFLRTVLGKTMRTGRPPQLRFRYDATAEVSEQLAEIVREDEAAAAAADREDES